MEKIPIKAYFLLGVFVLIGGSIILSGFLVNVEPGYEGILIDKAGGGVQKEALSPGWHFKTPITQSIEVMEIRTQKLQDSATASSKDLQTVNTSIAINFRPVVGSTPKLYNQVGVDYQSRIIDPAVQESVKAVTARYNAEELITKREEVKAEIETDIEKKLTANNIIVEGVFITNFEFSPEFSNAIEQKQVAEQNALKAKNDLNRIQIEAEQKVVSAKAEAEAIQITGDALKQNPSLVQLEWVKKWDGKMPLYYGSESGVLVQAPSGV